MSESSYSAGSASIKISPDATGFDRDLKAKLEAMRIEAEVGIRPKDFDKFAADLEAGLKAINASIGIGVEVDQRSLGEAALELEGAADRLKPTTRLQVDTVEALAEVEAFKREVDGQTATIKVKADPESTRNAAKEAAKSFEGIGGDLLGAGKLNLGAIGIGNLPAAASGITSITAGIGQLSGVAGLLPGVLAGAGAAIGTLATGANGFLGAIGVGKDGSDAKKQAAALAGLSDNAKQAAGAVTGLKKDWSDLQSSVQDKLFANLGDSIKSLGEKDLPVVKTGMEGLATSMNTGVKSALDELSSGKSQGALSKIFGDTAQGIDKANGAIHPLIDSVETLATTGSSFLPELGQGFANLATSFDHFIGQKQASGELSKWIQDGITSAKELGQTVEHIGSTLHSVFGAADGIGEPFLKLLDDASGKLAALAGSAKGQDDLKAFFQEGHDELEKWEPILKDIPGLLQGIWAGAHAWSDVMMPFLTTAAGLLAHHETLVKDLVVAYLAFKTIGPIFDGVEAGITKVGGALTNLGTTSKAFGAAGLATSLEGTASKASMLAGVIPGIGTAIAVGVPLVMAGVEAFKAIGDAQARAHQHTLELMEGITAARTAMDSDLGVSDYKQALDDLGLTANNTTDAIDRLASTMDKGASPAQKQADATKTWNDSIRDLAPNVQAALQSVGGLNTALVNQQGEINTTGQAGSALAGEFSNMKTSYDGYVSTIAQTQGPIAAQQMAQQLTGQLEQQLIQTGLTKQQADGLLDTYGLMPGTIQKYMDALEQGRGALGESGTAATNTSILFDNLGNAINSVPNEKVITVNDPGGDVVLQQLKDIDAETHGATKQVIINYAYEAAGSAIPGVPQQVTPGKAAPLPFLDDHGITAGKATGGRLPSIGPGTDTTDGILAVDAQGMPVSRVDGGEWVINKGMSAQYDKELAAINAGIFPKLPGFAAGGKLPSTWSDSDQVDLESAQISLQEAQNTQSKDASDPKKTDLDRRKDAISVKKAQEQVDKLNDKKNGVGQSTSGYVTYGQQALPTGMSDTQTSTESDEMAVDDANANRNKVYADPTSTPEDKQKADLAYIQAQNTLQQNQQQGGSGAGSYGAADGAGNVVTDAQGHVSLNAIGDSFGKSIGQGFLSSFGLDQSILSPSNHYRADADKVNAYFGPDGKLHQQQQAGHYSYQPKNPAQKYQQSGDDSIGGYGAAVGEQSIHYTPGGGAKQWDPVIIEALQLEGYPTTPEYVAAAEAQIMTESGGNPNIVQQVHDVNSGGNEAQGLVQVTPRTAQALGLAELGGNLDDPLTNLRLGLRELKSQHGGDLLGTWGHGHGYALGGEIGGYGDGDVVPIMAEPNEFMVRRNVATRNRDALEALNAGRSWEAAGRTATTLPDNPAQLGTVTNHHDHSINMGDVHTMSIDQLERMLERKRAQSNQSILGRFGH